MHLSGTTITYHWDVCTGNFSDLRITLAPPPAISCPTVTLATTPNPASQRYDIIQRKWGPLTLVL